MQVPEVQCLCADAQSLLCSAVHQAHPASSNICTSRTARGASFGRAKQRHSRIAQRQSQKSFGSDVRILALYGRRED